MCALVLCLGQGDGECRRGGRIGHPAGAIARTHGAMPTDSHRSTRALAAMATDRRDGTAHLRGCRAGAVVLCKGCVC